MNMDATVSISQEEIKQAIEAWLKSKQIKVKPGSVHLYPQAGYSGNQLDLTPASCTASAKIDL